MDPLVNLLEDIKRQRAEYLKTRELLEQRKFTTHENRGQGVVDTTAETIVIIDRVIAEFDKILAEQASKDVG